MDTQPTDERTVTAAQPGWHSYRPPGSLAGLPRFSGARDSGASRSEPKPPAAVPSAANELASGTSGSTPSGRPGSPQAPAPGPSKTAPPAPRGVKKRVLVVDDEKDFVDLVTYNLDRHGYEVLTAFTGPEALEKATAEVPDLIILDLMLPGMEGTEVARRLKSQPKTQHVPILMLTAKAEETDVVVGLTVGADDYVTKPFSMKILLARLSAVLRRGELTAAPADEPEEAVTLTAGPLTIDMAKHEAAVHGEALKLTLTEFKLLSALVSARGRVLSRDQLMDRAMGSDVFVTDRAIDVHITAIRRKLGDAAYLVRTVRGVGYRLQETPEEGESA